MGHLDDLRSDDVRPRLEAVYYKAEAGRCLNGVAHDLNNYLGTILAYAEILSLDVEDEDGKRSISEIIGSVRRCAKLANKLNGIARPEKANVSLVDLDTLVKEICELRAYDFRAAGVTLRTNLSGGFSLIADAPKLEMAVVSLLSNALENAALGDAKPVTEVSVAAEEDGGVLTVWDSGPPVPESEWDAIFEPFYTKRDGAHIGLGLHVVRQIAAYHDGGVSYHPGHGARLWLPRSNSLTPG
ncbi:MAG: sensor histidine kinase [Candidatus Hydrogenedentota bacterium]